MEIFGLSVNVQKLLWADLCGIYALNSALVFIR